MSKPAAQIPSRAGEPPPQIAEKPPIPLAALGWQFIGCRRHEVNNIAKF
jgi:hypothetical protein